MDLKTLFFNYLLIIFLNYFIVDIFAVKSRTVRPKKMPDKELKELRRKHESEMKKKFNKINDFHVFYKDFKPIFKMQGQRFVLLDQGYYTTLYDTEYKLPVYSAYTLHLDRGKKPGRENRWIINSGLTKYEQPTLEDYIGIGEIHFDRGHLYPQMYAAEDKEMKKYTNLITNIALQYKTFNMNTWKRMEAALYKASKTDCSFPGAKIYFLTGVLSSGPNGLFVDDINIPESFWTAVCCDSSTARSKKNKLAGWSFAYIVNNENQKSLIIDIYFVEEFLRLPGLKDSYRQFFKTNGEVKECLYNPSKTVKVVKQIHEGNNKDEIHLGGQLYDKYYKKGK